MNFHRHTLALFLICTSGLARAQAQAPAAKADPHDDPVSLEHLLVSTAPLGGSQIDQAQASTILTGLRLASARQATLGETLSAEPGMSSTYFGPGASRPIIRGQSGERLKLLENGSGTLDASSASPDHAVSIEPFLVKRIEIVRGPAALLYGSSAVGGVVNVLTHRIDDEAPTKAADTELALTFDSAANSWTRGGSTDIAVLRTKEESGTLVLHLDGFRRDAGDLRIPGKATQHTELEQDGSEEAHEEPTGILPNTALSAEGAAMGLSYVGPDFHVGLSYSGYNTLYGVPGHEHHHEEDEHHENAEAEASEEGVHIKLRQRRVDLQGESRKNVGPFTGLRFKLGHADYSHDEIEPDGSLGTRFTNRGHDARVELSHRAWEERLTGVFGLQQGVSEFSAQGEEAFVPSSRTSTRALFAFEEYLVGKLRLQAGLRLEEQNIEVAEREDKRKDQLAGISTGAVWKLSPTWSLTGNLSHSSRAPNAQELYADGPHAGTGSYEIGDDTLRSEQVSHFELGLRKKTGLVTGELSVFTQDFKRHIHSVNTGLLAVEGANGFEFVQANQSVPAEGLPVYKQVQSEARFTGFEVDTRWHLHTGEQHLLDLHLAADLVQAKTQTGPLPRIPAARTTLGLEWRHGPWSAGVSWQHGFEQNRVAENEAPSPSYDLLGATLTRCIQFKHAELDLFVRGSNLLDREIRPHTSFLRGLAPLAGRAVAIGMTLRF